MITADQIRDFASFAHNLNRWDLERAGIIQEGPAGEQKWLRFNTNLSGFILKLTGDQLEASPRSQIDRSTRAEPALAVAAE